MLKYGLLGKSLLHSRSKDYFLDKFNRDKIKDCSYENYEADKLETLREWLEKDKTIMGLNVTIPFKKEIITWLDELDPVAAEVGAVNCIKIIRVNNSLRLSGYNTDTIAFEKTLAGISKEEFPGAMVLGTGGAKDAICRALSKKGIQYIIVSRLKKEKTLNYAEISGDDIAGCRLIINTTPMGMFPDTGHCPALPYEHISDRHYLYDLIYNPEETMFLKKGREAGARVKNGLEMLYLQADLSWEIWNSGD